MLPVVSHETKTGRWPYVTVSLIGVNVLIFVFELSVGVRLVPFLQDWGLVPARVNAEITAHNLATVLSSMFLHVGVVHLVGNLWFLFVFGDAVEDALGPWWYLSLYLVSGFFGGMAILATSGSSPVPVVGASGAIAGVMAGSLVLWPRAQMRLPSALMVPLADWMLFQQLRLVAHVPIAATTLALTAVTLLLVGLAAHAAGGLAASLIRGVRVPAVVVLALFMAVQLLRGLLVLVNPAFGGSVGWWAHIGGFIAGGLFTAAAPRRLSATSLRAERA
jgi:membrane associated rhomboid family serine protease